MKIDVNNIQQIRNLKAIFNIMGLDVSVSGIVSLLLATKLYEELGEETTIRDISKIVVDVKDIMDMFKIEIENEE